MEAKYLYMSIPRQSFIGLLQVIGIFRAKIFLEEMVIHHKMKHLGPLITTMQDLRKAVKRIFCEPCCEQ